MKLDLPEVRVRYPDWVPELVDWDEPCEGDVARMRTALAVAHANVEHGGGPFGAAVYEQESGRLVSVGMNLVVPLGNSILHAETVAFMMAEARLGSYTLSGPGLPAHALYTTCAPCAMCLGACLWAGIRRLVWSAAREDALRVGFDEGPVLPESWDYLRERGIAIQGDVLRAEGRALLELYRARHGVIYNG